MQSLNSLKQDDALIALLSESKTIAIVGLSAKEQRPSNMIGRYLVSKGYTIYPVNPGQDEILGLHCYSEVLRLPSPVDIINIFRKSQDVLPLVEQIITLPKLPRAIWMQQGVVNDEAAALAKEKGIMVIMDRCIMVDHQKLVK